MANKNEVDAFEHFQFRIGQRVKSRHAGYSSGFVIERSLVEDSGGIRRIYLVRHSIEECANYQEFEIEFTP